MTRKCQELTGNVWIFEPKHIRIFSAKRKKIHAAIPHNAFINDGIPLIQFFVRMDHNTCLPHHLDRFTHTFLI